MSSKYCIHCGHKQEGKFAKFCSKCGQSLNPSFSISKKGSQPISEDETDASEVPHIDKIDVDVVLPSSVIKIKHQNGKLTFESADFETRNLDFDVDH